MTVRKQAAALAVLLPSERIYCMMCLTHVLAILDNRGLGDSPMADSLRDEMDVYWRAMTEDEQARTLRSPLLAPPDLSMTKPA